LLGILRCGASYVPLRADLPEARLRQICTSLDVDYALVGHRNAHPSCAHAFFDASVIANWVREHAPTDSDAAPIQGDSEAYVIFTSGSTGSPLGIPILHQQLAASTLARFAVYPEAPERFLLLSDISFDSSVVGIFWTLATGGLLVIPTEAERSDIDRLIGHFTTGGITHTLCVPVLYGALLKRAEQRADTVGWPRQVIVAGDYCLNWVKNLHFKYAPQSALANEFGPTEATVWATVTHYAAGLDDGSVGGPIPGTWVAVLDAEGAVAAEGQEGDLVIGGSNVSTGYIDANAANAARFGRLSDWSALSVQALQFVYSGDRALVMQGRITLLGRNDTLLKLNGHRISAVEIEGRACEITGATNALLTVIDARDLPEIMGACNPAQVGAALQAANNSDMPEAVLRQILGADAGDHLELTIILETDVEPDFAALTAALTADLGVDVVPRRFAHLPNFPLTRNEKVDRAKTFAMALDALLDTPKISAVAAPLASTENGSPPVSDKLFDLILGIFRTELRKPSLTGEQSFFDHGGHSLRALDMLLKIEKATGLRLSTTIIYQHSTAKALAHALSGAVETVKPAPTMGDGATLSWTAPTPLENFESIAIQGREILARPLPQAGGFRTLNIPLQLGGSRPPVFAIHNIGPGASYFTEIAAELGPDQPFYCLGKPVEFTTIRRFDEMMVGDLSVEDICRVYADEIERVVPQGPFIITALCGGVPFGHATALELSRRGRMPVLNVMLADWHAPMLHLAEESNAKKIWKHRWNQLRREKLNLLWTFRKRAPASLLLRKKLIERKIETLMLRYYERRGLELTTRLISRKAIEEGLGKLQAFEHFPYDGPSLSIRSIQDPNFWLDGKEQGWSGVLSDWTFKKVDGLGFGIIEQPFVRKTADVYRSATGSFLANIHSRPRQIWPH
jgi:acyl-CoA synthetase (AMP-forming)/AMP-acid ligase II/thioesterase domain-containing protein/acyl carrier protein